MQTNTFIGVTRDLGTNRSRSTILAIIKVTPNNIHEETFNI